MQRIQDCVTRSKCQLIRQLHELQFSNSEDFYNFIEKWSQRYQLRMTPKQRYDAKKKGQPTFDLIVHIPLSFDDNFTKNLIDFAQDDLNSFQKPDIDLLAEGQDFCPIRLYLFCNIDSEKVYSHVIPASSLNDLLKEQIEGCEYFNYVHEIDVMVGHYEFIRLTQKRSLVAEIEGHTKNKYDWTWRLSKVGYGNLQKAGEQLINRFHQHTDKSDDEKRAYFEKHLRILEGMHGFRGVRKQIGQLYSAEKKDMKRKYGEKSLQYYRPLILKYIQRSKDQVPANSAPEELLNEVKRIIMSAAKAK